MQFSQQPDPIRLTVVDQMSVQSPHNEPVGLGRGFSRFIQSQEQVYRRRVKLTTEWTTLDLGWFNDKPIGMIHLENVPEQTKVFRTEDAIALMNQQLVLVGYAVPIEVDSNAVLCFAQVRVGESIRFEPFNASKLRVRCQTGVTYLQLTIIPGDGA